MNKKVLEAIQEKGLEELNQKLLAYSYQRLSRLRWQHKKEGTTKGRLANDFVQEALTKALKGEERKWNPQKQPDIQKYLEGIISSLISNAITSSENKSSSITTPQDLHEINSPKIISEIHTKEEELLADEMYQTIKKSIEDSENDGEVPLTLIFDSRVVDGMAPIEIAEILDIEISVVRNAIKRIRRISLKVINGINNEKQKA